MTSSVAVERGGEFEATVPAPPTGPRGLTREHPFAPSVLDEALTEQVTGKELQVEADPSCPFGGQRLLEVHHDAERLPRRLDPYPIGEPQIRIFERIEALSVARLVRILHAHADLVAPPVHLPRAHLGDRRPLARCGLQTQVPVGGDPGSVLNDRDPALMPLRIEVVGQHHVEARHLKVFELVDDEPGSVSHRDTLPLRQGPRRFMGFPLVGRMQQLLHPGITSVEVLGLPALGALI